MIGRSLILGLPVGGYYHVEQLPGSSVLRNPARCQRFRQFGQFGQCTIMTYVNKPSNDIPIFRNRTAEIFPKKASEVSSPWSRSRRLLEGRSGWPANSRSDSRFSAFGVSLILIQYSTPIQSPPYTGSNVPGAESGNST
jgi:hypothetical protein